MSDELRGYSDTIGRVEVPSSGTDDPGVTVPRAESGLVAPLHNEADFAPPEIELGLFDKIRIGLYFKSLYTQYKEYGMTNDLKATLIGFGGGVLTWLGSFLQSGQPVNIHGILAGLGVFALGWITNKGHK